MISQSAIQSTGGSTAQVSLPVQPKGKWDVWAGFKAAIRDGVIPFLQSWHPGYAPPGLQSSAQPDKGPAFTFGSPDGQDSSFFQGVALGVRLVSSYAELPAQISTMLEGVVTFSAVDRLFGALGTTTASTPQQSGADSPVDCLPTNDKGRKKKAPQQTPQRTSPLATARTGPLPKAAVALGALSSLTVAAAASGSNTEGWIAVPNATTLGKIGRDPDYPLNGTYRQTVDIDGGSLSHSIGNKTHAFTGQYDGQCRTIGNLSQCMVKALAGDVDSLRFTNASIRSSNPAGVVACEVSGGGTASNIRVEHSHVTREGDGYGGSGIVGGNIRGTVANITAVDCSVRARGVTGIGGGYAKGTVANITAINCTVEGKFAGIGVGSVFHGSVVNTIAMNCTVNTCGGHGGIGAGAVYDEGSVANTIAMNCTVKTHRGDAGIGAGRVKNGTVANTYAANSTIESKYGNGNIGGGPDPTICNVHVNGELRHGSAGDCRYLPDHFCEDIHPRLVRSDCQPGDYQFGALTSDTVTGLESSPASRATLALPASAAPLVASPGTGATAVIALWASAFVLACGAGVCIYRCLRRPAAAADLQGVVTINNTGDQEADYQPMAVSRREAREKPAGKQRSRIPPPKPPRQKYMAAQEKTPIPARNPFIKELRDEMVNRHLHIENKDIYANVGAYEDDAAYEEVGVCEDDGAYEIVGEYEEVVT